MVASIQLSCLKGVALMGLNDYLRMKNAPIDSTGTVQFKDFLEELRTRGYFWTEPYRTRWSAIMRQPFEDLPLPTLDMSRRNISFAHVFAVVGWTGLIVDEINQVGSIADPEYYYCNILNTLLMGPKHAPRNVRSGPNPIFETCEFILSHVPNPDFELINVFGERISVLNSAACAYNKCMPFLPIPSIERWIGQANYNTKFLPYGPTMIDCSSLIARRYTYDAYIFAATCSEEAADLRKLPRPSSNLSGWHEKLEAQIAQYIRPPDVRILCFWESGLIDVPQMYAVAARDYARVLSHFWSEANWAQVYATGIIRAMTPSDTCSRLLTWIETTDVKLPKLRSLIEAFRLLGKSDSSIEAFLAVEEP